jgi:carboxymethylenebutenolidase
MCDEHSIDDIVATEVSRRRFSQIGMGVGLAALLPQVANAHEVSESEVTIKTPDGTADAHFVHPKTGAFPAVLVWPDIFGLRPAFREMGTRLAESGFAVLTVNPFYRIQKAPTAPPGASFQDPATREKLMAQMGSLSATTHTTDAKAFIAWLDQQKAVDTKKKIGTTGYCMGGPIVVRTAAAVPDRVGAGGTFHGGGLTTKAPDSPHLSIAKSKASFLIAIADNDDKQDPTSKDILKQTFADAKLPGEVEVYTGAQHGWCAIDSQVYHPEQAAKAWWRLLATFNKALV